MLGLCGFLVVVGSGGGVYSVDLCSCLFIKR